MSIPPPLVEAIMNGRFDSHLDQLVNLIQQRKVLVGQQLLTSLQVGDMVRFNMRTRPQYLRGRSATVARIAGDKAFVTLTIGAGKYRAGAQIGTPATLLERVQETNGR
jgi:hypothetical protein